MFEIHFADNDMPVFPYPGESISPHWVLKHLPFWVMTDGQEMRIPYSDEMFKILNIWAISMQKLSTHSRAKHGDKWASPQYWKIYKIGKEIGIVKHKNYMLNTPIKRSNERQRRLAEINRIIIGQSIEYTNYAGVTNFIIEIKKIEKLTLKEFEWIFEGNHYTNVTRVK